MSADKGDSGNNMLDELNAQDEVASMLDDHEVMDQLEEIGRMQRSDRLRDKITPPEESKHKKQDNSSEVVMMTAPQESASGFEGLLDDDSLDGGVVNGAAEESFDFNPPEAMSTQMAATGFDAEFTETVDMKSNVPPVAAPTVKEIAPPQHNPLAASSRALLSGLGNSRDMTATMGSQRAAPIAQQQDQDDTLFDKSVV